MEKDPTKCSVTRSGELLLNGMLVRGRRKFLVFVSQETSYSVVA